MGARLVRALVVMGSWNWYGRPYVTLGDMDELHRASDKFRQTADHLNQAIQRIDPDEPDPNALDIALAEAKRVRRASTLLTRALARLRDQLQP